MSVTGLDAAEQALVKSTEIDTVSYFKEIAGNRVYHFFETPKLVVELAIKGFGTTNLVLGTLFNGLSKIVNTEGVVLFAQDMLTLPEKVSAFSHQAAAWWKGDVGSKNFANEGRKFVGYIGTAVSDYVGGCSGLKNLGIDVSGIDKISAKVGSFGGLIGALSRITDYATNDKEVPKPIHALTPQGENIRSSILESRNFWELSRDVSICALCIFSLTIEAAQVPVILSVGLSSMILGSRMASYYNELQIKEVDKSHVAADKNVVKV